MDVYSQRVFHKCKWWKRQRLRCSLICWKPWMHRVQYSMRYMSVKPINELNVPPRDADSRTLDHAEGSCGPEKAIVTRGYMTA